MIDVTLLGTGGMYPLPDRALTSLYIRFAGRAVLIDCLGYCFNLNRPGRFDLMAAKVKGIPQKLWGRLQKGECVDGFTPADVLGARRTVTLQFQD